MSNTISLFFDYFFITYLTLIGLVGIVLVVNEFMRGFENERVTPISKYTGSVSFV